MCRVKGISGSRSRVGIEGNPTPKDTQRDLQT